MKFQGRRGIAMTKHNKTTTPVCPHCDRAMDINEMAELNLDIFTIAPHEEILNEPISCPGCRGQIWILGGYDPHYTTRATEKKIEEVQLWANMNLVPNPMLPGK